MKTKNLYVLAVGVFSILLILILIVVPFFLFIDHLWTASTIVSVLIILGLVLYMINMPGHKMHKFYDYVPITTIKKVKALKYSYSKAKYPFSCGQSVIQMYLEKVGVLMDQDEIIKLSGDKALGTSPWEMEETLNKIFKEKELPYKARLEYCTPYSHLFDAIAAGNGVIVMFINQFHEEGYSSTASYPHFALLNYINIGSEVIVDEEPKKKRKEKKKVVKKDEEKKKKSGKIILTNPSFSLGRNPHFAQGKYDGEVKMPIPEFQERFYMGQKCLNRLRHKPTRKFNFFVRNGNRILNFFFIAAFYVGYCMKVLKPGTAIFIEKVKQ